MAFQIRIHYDNANGFARPHLWQWADGSTATADVAPAGHDGFGAVFDVQTVRSEFRFKFKDGPGTGGPWEGDRLDRFYSWLSIDGSTISPDEIWTTAGDGVLGDSGDGEGRSDGGGGDGAVSEGSPCVSATFSGVVSPLRMVISRVKGWRPGDRTSTR